MREGLSYAVTLTLVRHNTVEILAALVAGARYAEVFFFFVGHTLVN